jgi:C4-dicarboxylate-specific signal transduction histidine kinase
MSMNDMSSARARLARLASMGQLAAAIGHEVQQPLAGIALNAEAALRWLDRPQADVAQAKAALAVIIEAAARANEAVRSVRRLARQDAAEAETCQLDAILAEVISPLRQRLACQRIALSTDFGHGACAARADRAQLRQLLHNLMTNAIDALAGVDGRERALHVATRYVDGARILVSVGDTGAGLPRHRPESVFEPLVTSKADGMGMGLAICRAIVEAHGGVLLARCGDVHGSVFEFTMPAAPVHLAGEPPARPSPARHDINA